MNQLFLMESQRPRICIIAQNAYGALCGGYKGHIGGAEWQTSLMARWLSAHDWKASLIVWQDKQPMETIIDGVHVITMCRQDAGIFGLRFIYPRMTSLFAALRKADADIYYHNSAEYVTGLAAAWCHHHHRKFIYSAAAELACDVRLPLISKSYERMLYGYGMRRADLRIVQTNRQRELLKAGWNLDSTLLPMPCPGPSPTDYEPPLPPKRPRVVWVGRIYSGKRLEWLLDIAEQMPDVLFDVAGANADGTEYSAALQQRAGTLPNVRWLGAVPREQMPKLYQNATCLCCTSAHEGFPNTFLEAWSHGTPVVSSWDPDGLINRLELGLVALMVPDFVRAIQSLISTPNRWRECSHNSRYYYEHNHLVDAAMSRFLLAFSNLTRARV